MSESLSVGETSSVPRKRRGKYCAAFDCNNSAYDVNGTRTSFHFFKFPKDAQRRNQWCSLIKRRHGQDGFVVSTATVLCHEHFRAEDISKKLSGRWNLKSGLWYCWPFCYVYMATVLRAFMIWAIKNLKFKDILVLRNKDSFNFSQIKDFGCFIVNFKI